MTFVSNKKGMTMLATNIIQQKAPKALSKGLLKGIRDRNYSRALLMFVKGDGGVKELLGGDEMENGREERKGILL